MAKTRFLCVSKTGKETFTVHLEPDTEGVSPACEVCGRRSHEEFCFGQEGESDVAKAEKHKAFALVEGDTTFFKDLPHASIFLSVLTPEAAAEFEVGKYTTVEFKLER